MKSATLLLAAAGVVAAKKNCSVESISQFLPKNSTVFYANHYAKGANFTPPIDLNYGLTSIPSGADTVYEVPLAGCVAQANISLPNNTQHSVGFVLPDDWNGRFMAVGNGEFSGSVGWSAIMNTMWYGFASVSTDTGHEGNNGSFGYHNEVALANWGYRALHDAVVNGKKVTEGYYEDDISYSYYRGCSAGGKQGFKEVEMFPEDFDGVIAGAPAWWTSHQQLWNVLTAIWNLPETADYHVSDAQMTAVQDEILKQCDPQDGLKDNILQNPLGCVFDPVPVMCNSTSSNDTCVTPAQLVTVNKLFSPWIEANDTFVFPGYTLGTEVGAPSLSDDFVTYIQYMLQIGGDWTWEDWNPDLVALSDKINPGNATANDFDISPFYKKGGKLLHYHGYSDPSIATGSSIYLYNHIQEALRPQDIPIDDFYRFFLIPGMEHCTSTPSDQDAPFYMNGDSQAGSLSGTVYGVPGFNDSKHDLILAMVDWVENDNAPSYLIPTKYKNDDVADGVDKQRPICPHPQLAKYNGTGDVNSAENWHCSTLY
ncbi:tannase and feruloyl esterase [Aspergillus sclerotioniger CBS 115572]|uniref:Carboxylic ester hydrolase n=1 Tax=Aspergillus sclerotioniger CBS 115572 TaxID=1450535 RepID=A0A317WQK7_9EURO|nr:tannase and feruloyl esterase [Aspergillus sclerotioniger CBS 115572]PWY86460.1 tannase and feruloyl esterase [Aspergillus sclerotioniger CBS 115572]